MDTVYRCFPPAIVITLLITWLIVCSALHVFHYYSALYRIYYYITTRTTRGFFCDENEYNWKIKLDPSLILLFITQYILRIIKIISYSMLLHYYKYSQSNLCFHGENPITYLNIILIVNSYMNLSIYVTQSYICVIMTCVRAYRVLFLLFYDVHIFIKDLYNINNAIIQVYCGCLVVCFLYHVIHRIVLALCSIDIIISITFYKYVHVYCTGVKLVHVCGVESSEGFYVNSNTILYAFIINIYHQSILNIVLLVRHSCIYHTNSVCFIKCYKVTHTNGTLIFIHVIRSLRIEHNIFEQQYSKSLSLSLCKIKSRYCFCLSDQGVGMPIYLFSYINSNLDINMYIVFNAKYTYIKYAIFLLITRLQLGLVSETDKVHVCKLLCALYFLCVVAGLNQWGVKFNPPLDEHLVSGYDIYMVYSINLDTILYMNLRTYSVIRYLYFIYNIFNYINVHDCMFMNVKCKCLCVPPCWVYGEKTLYSNYIIILYTCIYTIICYPANMQYLERTKGKFWGVGDINSSPHHIGVFLTYTDYG